MPNIKIQKAGAEENGNTLMRSPTCDLERCNRCHDVNRLLYDVNNRQ
jgi:hypothetical protein